MKLKDKPEDPAYVSVVHGEFSIGHLEGNSSSNNDPGDWNHSSNVLILQEVSKDAVPLVSLPFDVKVIITLIIMLSLLVGSHFKCIMYRYVFTTNKRNHGWMHRPINVLVVSSAIIHHVTHVSIGIWYIVLMMIENPLGLTMGLHYCQIMDVVGVYGIAYLSVGSLGIAIYRVFYIKHEYFVKYVVGETLLLFIVWSLSLVTCGIIVFLFKLEDSSHRFQINMCSGSSVTYSQIMIEYELSRGHEMLTTTYLQTGSILACILIQTIEFGIYIWFFYTRYKNDNGNIKKLLSEETIRKRNIKNVGTFLSQFYGFMVEYTFLLSILVLMHFADKETHQFKAFANIAKLIDFGLLSIVEVLASPGLRAFIK